MKTIRKVQLIVWTKNSLTKEPEFFVIHRPLQQDCVILTGKIGDRPEICHESPKEAAIRELQEELNIAPVNIVDLHLENKAMLENNILSVEYPFLIEIPTKDVKFLEYEAQEDWISKTAIVDTLTYKTQRDSLQAVLQHENQYF